MKRILKISSKILLTLILFLFLGGLLVFYAMQLPKFQTWAIEKYLTPWISSKLGSNIKIGRAEMKWLDELTLHDVLIEDHKKREMIFVEELYVNYKTNLSFDTKNIINFDNNLDYVMVKNPRVRLIYEPDGDLNIDKWIYKIEELTASTDTTHRLKGEHNKPFTIDEAYIQGGTFTLEDPDKKRFPKEEFDYNTFTVNKLQGNLNNFFIQGDTITFELKNMKGIERRSDLIIKQLDTKFFYSRQHLRFDNLYAKINNSTLKNRIHFNYRTPRDFKHFNSLVEMDADLRDCEIDAQDLGRFATDMYAYQEMYLLKGDFKGTVEDFRVKNFNLKFGKNSFLDGEIAFKGMPELETVKMDLNWKSSQLDAIDTRQYVGDSLYQKHVYKFGVTRFVGTFKGVYNDFQTDAKISSDMGNVSGNLTMKIPSDLAKANYFGSLDVDGFELGKLVEEREYLQKLSFSGKINGKGLTIKDAELGFDGKVKNIDFNGYNYKNIYVDGTMSQSLFDGRVSVKDTNLAFDVSGKVDFAKALNKFDIHGKLQNANLRPLGYAKNDVKLQSEINLNFQGNELDNWIGEAKLLHTILQYDKRKLGIDSLFLNSSLSDNSRKISLLSEFFNIDLSGKFTPSTVISDVKRLSKEYTQYFVNKEKERLDYYTLIPNYSFPEKYFVDYKVSFKKSSPFFDYFYPSLFISNGTVLDGSLVVQNNANLSLSGKIDTLRHDNLVFYNSTLDVNTAKESASPKILTSLIFESAKQKLADMAPTENLEISGSWGQGNEIDFDGRLKQQNSQNKAQVYGKFVFLPDGFDIAFNPKNTKLNLLGSNWTLGNNNLINIQSGDICFQNLQLANENQSLSLNGTLSPDSTKEASVQVHDFDLQTLKPLSDLDLKGILNGKLTLRDMFDDGVVTSDFGIDELVYKNMLVGTIAGEVLWDNIKQKLNINGNIIRINNEIFRLAGTYDPKDDRNPLNLKANLKRTNLEIFETFVDDIFSNIGGYATGTLTIRGTASDPIIRGTIDTEKGILRINELNSYLYFDDKILFNEEGFVVEKGFKVRDNAQNGNIAELEGGIFNGGGGNFMLGLHAYMKGRDGFKIMNTTDRDNDDFYGVAYTTGDLHITGDFDNVVINANLTSKKGTRISIPLDNETSVDTEEEGLKFVSKKTQSVTAQVVKKDSVEQLESGSLKMAFNFNITPDAECEVIFDRTNKDKLNAFGSGQISIDYDTKGGFTMSGPYTIKNGKYDFSLQNISSLRKFDIAEGSWLRWSGDPYDADIDIKANYSTNLMIDNIVQGIANSPELKQRYPVNAYVLLTGKLMTPTVKYDIKFNQRQIPMSLQPQVIAFEQRLRDDEQLMGRNFIGVSALNRFFPDNSFKDVLDTQLLVDNVSSILNNQIGNLANKIDPNLEIGVQLGNVRDNLINNMQLNLAYRYNRMKVSLSNTVLQNQSQTQTNNYFYGGELEYLLSEDGTWRLKGYSRNMPTYFYNTALQGTTNPTVFGVSIQHTRNFNSFFKRKTTNKIPMGVVKNKPAEEIELSKID